MSCCEVPPAAAAAPPGFLSIPPLPRPRKAQGARQPASPPRLSRQYIDTRPGLPSAAVLCTAVVLHFTAALTLAWSPCRLLPCRPAASPGGPARHCRSSLGPAGFCRARLARPGTIAGLAGPAGTNAGPRLAVSYCSGEGVSLLSTNTATLITGLQFWRPRHCSPAVQHSSLCRICCSHTNHTRRG